jgi:hypothetical protein
MTFREFIEQKKTKPWVAKKKDVLQLWKSIPSDAPLNPAPVSKYHSGNRFDQDGVRITGSSQFVNSVMGRLKPFLSYTEHPNLELDVKYRQILRKDVSDKPSFACYINVLQKKQ